jgi:SSS family transporter
MQAVLTPLQGILFLVGYGLLMILITGIATRHRQQDTAEFLLSGRSVGILLGATSIAAAWIWAPSLFVSGQKAYEQGLPGLFWFLFPNLLALIVFAPLSLRIRRVLPRGYTFPQFIRLRHGKRVHRLYLIQFVVLQLCSFAVQILAGATLLQTLFGLPFLVVVVCLVVIVLTYALLGGLRASVATDIVQMALILGICAVTIPWAIIRGGGLDAVADGLGGVTGQFGNLFDPWVAYSFGISTTIGLLSGPIGDQMHWQRGYALKSDGDVIKTFVLGACIFILVPLSLSMLGFIAAGKVHDGAAGWSIASAQMVGPATVQHLLPPFMLFVFSLMLLSGLCSTLDSVLCALASIAVADFYMAGRRPEELDSGAHRKLVRLAQVSMLVAAIVGCAISLIPGLKILHLFLFYGTLRASTMIPTVLTLYWPRLSSTATFYAVLISMLVGAPLMALGQYRQDPQISVAGSILVVALGFIICVGMSLMADNPGRSLQDNQSS